MSKTPKSVPCEACGGPARPSLQHAAPTLCRHCHRRFIGRPEGDEINPEVSIGNVHPSRAGTIAYEDGDGASGYPAT
jgi:hypothetical protein